MCLCICADIYVRYCRLVHTVEFIINHNLFLYQQQQTHSKALTPCQDTIFSLASAAMLTCDIYVGILSIRLLRLNWLNISYFVSIW